MKIHALFLFEFKKILKSPVTFLFMIVAPLLLLSLLSYGLQPLLTSKNIIERFDVAIVNIDDTKTSRSIIEQFESSEEFSNIVSFLNVTENEATELLEDNKVASIVIIPEGFSSSLKKGENYPLKVIGNYQRPLQSSLFKEMMKSALNLITAAQSGVNTAYYYLNDEITNKEMKVTVKEAIVHFTFHSLNRNEVFEEEKFEVFPFFTTIQYYSSSAIILILYIISLFSIVIISTKESATINKRLITFGVGFSSWLFAKFFTVLTILFIQTLIIVMTFILFLEQFVIEDILIAIIVLLTTIVTISALNTLLISLRLNALITSILALITYSFMSYAGGSFIPLTLLPDSISIFSSISINTWAHSALLNSLFISDTQEVTSSSFKLMIFSIVMLLMSLAITKLRMRQL
jgi:ABC-2 type transport system permease protein